MGRIDIYVKNEDTEAIERIKADFDGREFSSFAVSAILEAYNAKCANDVLSEVFGESLEQNEQRQYNRKQRNIILGKTEEDTEEDIPELETAPKKSLTMVEKYAQQREAEPTIEEDPIPELGIEVRGAEA